jgi:hypothetical protein
MWRSASSALYRRKVQVGSTAARGRKIFVVSALALGRPLR